MKRSLVSYLLLVAILAISSAAWKPNPYNEDLAFNLSLLSGSVYCPIDDVSGNFLATDNATKTVGANVHGMGYSYFSSAYKVLDVMQNELKMVIYKNDAEKRFAVVFEGTHGKFQLITELMQWNVVPFDIHPQDNLYVDSYFIYHYKDAFRTTLLDNLTAIRQEYSDYSIIFAGHSLGGSFANLAAVDAVLSELVDGDQIEVYTFGQPRTGNWEWAELTNSRIRTYYRVVHYKDTVPHVPLCATTGNCIKASSSKNYYHVNTEVWYTDANMTRGNYVLCEDESSSCSNQFSLLRTNPLQHLWYFGIRVSCEQVSVYDFINKEEVSHHVDKKGFLALEN